MTHIIGVDDVIAENGKTFIVAEPGVVVTVKMAEPGECRAFGLPLWEAKLLWVFTYPDGTTTTHPADGVTVIFDHAPGRSMDTP